MECEYIGTKINNRTHFNSKIKNAYSTVKYNL